MLDSPSAARLHLDDLWARYDAHKREGLSLDMTRGKPSEEQLSLSNAMLAIGEFRSKDGFDCRNYSPHLDGLPEARKLCAAYLGTRPENTLVTGNSSLQLMYSVITEHMLRGGWSAGSPKFICPEPGYDRHFQILRNLGIGMVPVPMNENGPDMDIVRDRIQDPDVVGMWCMPRYSNPTGVSYSRSVSRAIAELKPKNGRFIVMWDDAYREHHLGALTRPDIDIMKLAREAKTEDRFWIFGSFSKVTFASAGISMLAASPRSLEWFRKRLAAQTIGPDKLTQLRHVLFLKNLSGIRAHMRKHARIIRPKFKVVCDELERAIGKKGIARWEMPDGGYFISFYMETGSARRVVELARGLGLLLTPAGAAFVKGDPEDSHIRIAPTYPSLADVRKASQLLCLCAEIAHREAHPQTMKR